MIPYFLLGFVPLLLHVSDRMDQPLLEVISNPGLIVENLIAPIVRNYVTGRFLTAYWYIPFIMSTFLLLPLHIRFIRVSLSAQLLIVGVLSCIAIFMHRPMWNVNVLQSVVYYAPIYLIGIMASIYKDVVYKSLENKDFLLLAVAIGIAVFQAYLGIVGNYHKPILEFNGIDLIFVQKIFLSFFFMIFLHRFEHLNNKFIHTVASTSFAIFFIHPLILKILEVYLEITVFRTDSWLVFSLVVSGLVLVCVLIAKLIRKILQSKSRYLIGY